MGVVARWTAVLSILSLSIATVHPRVKGITLGPTVQASDGGPSNCSTDNCVSGFPESSSTNLTPTPTDGAPDASFHPSPVLPVVMTSNYSGYVTGCEDFTLGLCNASYTVQVPAGYAVMISFPEFDLPPIDPRIAERSFVQVFAIEKDGSRIKIWKLEGYKHIEVDVYLKPLWVHFYNDWKNMTEPYLFKMLFSIHPLSRMPEKIGYDLFNCSVPFYDEFKAHVHCNTRPQCYGGEDEGPHCPFSTPACNGWVAVGGRKCYFHVLLNKRLRWPTARAECQDRGGDLAIVRTPEEWQALQLMSKLAKIQLKTYIGLRGFDPSMPAYYRDAFFWVDDTTDYRQNTREMYHMTIYEQVCFHLSNVKPNDYWLSFVSCDDAFTSRFICEIEAGGSDAAAPSPPAVSFAQPADPGHILAGTNQSLTLCPAGHVTHTFLACDVEGQCGTDVYVTDCAVDSGNAATPGLVVAMFPCEDDRQTIPHTLVCDFRADCRDGSDEAFCVHRQQCEGFTCRSGQCIGYHKRCDVVRDCWDGSDEVCTHFINMEGRHTRRLHPPALVHFDGRGNFSQTPMAATDPCPRTHFRCSEGYCLPVYCRCNGVNDCLGHEDERDCPEFRCPGFYRCRSSTVCLHADHLCDGWPQCPQHDDELLCDAECPDGCRCQGHAFVCPHPFPVTSFPHLRYVDASGSGLSSPLVTDLRYLVWLSLARCDLRDVSEMDLPNLRTLHLTHNSLSSLKTDVFLALGNLRSLDVSHNPIVTVPTAATASEKIHTRLLFLELTHTRLELLNGSIFSNYPGIQVLNISKNEFKSILYGAFKHMPNLMTIDLRGNKIQTFSSNLFKSLTKLQTVYTDNYKLCCRQTLPKGFDEGRCFAPRDEISSCEDLLHSDVFRTFLWTFSVLSVMGNFSCLVARIVLQKKKSSTGFSIFVTHLSIADMIMGIYLACVGIADSMYRGHYFWYEATWKSSFFCHFAGFLSLLSCETSAFMIFLITLDRFLVLNFPFSEVHFRKKSALFASGLVCLLGLVIAVIPLLPMTSEWEFYSQTGICVPLPVTRGTFRGRNYAFGILIIFNLVLFLLIATGQALIYWTIQKTSMSHSSTRKTKDLTIARRLISIVVSDFLCWFPIGLLGVMASYDIAIPGEVNVGMVIFVLPLNAALNPFLYTFSALMERWNKKAEEKLMKQLEACTKDLKFKFETK